MKQIHLIKCPQICPGEDELTCSHLGIDKSFNFLYVNVALKSSTNSWDHEMNICKSSTNSWNHEKNNSQYTII